MAKTLVEIAHEIIVAQAALKEMDASYIGRLFREVFDVLHAESAKAEAKLKAAEETPAQDTPTATLTSNPPSEALPESAVQPPESMDSIGDEKITCLKCGSRFDALTHKHLKQCCGMTAEQYRETYDLPKGTPLLAKSIAARRSTTAKKRGIPPALKSYWERKKSTPGEQPTAEASQAPAAAPKKHTRPAKKRSGGAREAKPAQKASKP